MTKPVILIATTVYGSPTTGTVHNAYHMATMRICRNAELEFVPLAAFVQADIVRARSGLVRDFLAHPTATHLLFWDEDVVAEPEVLAALLKGLVESGHDYVGVPYPKKKIQWAKVWDWFYLNQRRPEPGEIDRVAFGCARKSRTRPLLARTMSACTNAVSGTNSSSALRQSRIVAM